MVKYAILGYDTLNIGDDMQSLITSILLPRVDYIIFRDNYDMIYDFKTGSRIKNIDEKVILIMNGNIYKDAKLPHNDNIIPFYISTSLFFNNLGTLKNTCIDNYRNNLPFYSKDKYTSEKLLDKEIPSTYYGCLTQLFLPEHLSLDKPNNKNITIFVDVDNKYIEQYKIEHSLDKIIKITHYSDIYWRLSPIQRLDMCMGLLKIYYSAKKIITTRLHCFLPCRGLGLNVEYVGPINERTVDLVSEIPDTVHLLSVFKYELYRLNAKYGDNIYPI